MTTKTNKISQCVLEYTRNDNSIEFNCERCNVRNAIEDNPRSDGRNKTNAYCHDGKQLNQEISKILENGSLPLKFHTHPTKSNEHFETILNQIHQTDTSDQDIRESENHFSIEGKKVLMPRCLIVGNSLSSSDIFIGVYGGFIAPVSFEASKKKVIDEKIKKSAEFLSTVEFTTGQKIGFAVGAALLLFSKQIFIYQNNN